MEGWWLPIIAITKFKYSWWRDSGTSFHDNMVVYCYIQYFVVIISVVVIISIVVAAASVMLVD